MRILSAGRWQDGYLDYYRAPDEYRIQVLAIKNLEELKDLYVLRPKSVRLVMNYLRHIGPRAVLRKISSRLSEERRNQKYISAGVGQVLESPDEGRFAPGELVCFLAPAHPAALERLTLPEIFILPAASSFRPAENYILRISPAANREKWWRPAAGWNRFAGINLPAGTRAGILEGLQKEIAATDWRAAERLEAGSGEVVTHVRLRPRSKKPEAILFGYGNYAKTIVLPNLAPYLRLAGVHEIDPAQIFPLHRAVPDWDTSPFFRDKEEADVALIAGYHHTHAGLAAEAIRRKMYAVVEKPLVTTRAELLELTEVLEKNPGKLFAGFHKRYSPFNDLIRSDLGVRHDHPLNYHAVAYEVPQPGNYWYRWPNSKGPVLANGCHWIDHFLYLNHWSRPAAKDVFVAPDQSVNVSLLLENGAFFSMVLTDKGSPRIGVQDHVEVRVDGGTARIVNDSAYTAERGLLLVRKKTINKMANYRAAYQAMAKTIVSGGAGDSLASVKISAETVLELEELCAKARARQARV